MSGIKHKRHIDAPDSDDTRVVHPSNWNDDHEVTGLLGSFMNLAQTPGSFPALGDDGAAFMQALSAPARTLLATSTFATMRVVLGAAGLISPAFTEAPTAPTAPLGVSTDQLATTRFVANAVAALINGSPELLNTLNELSAAVDNNPSFAASMATALGNRLRFDAVQSLTTGQKSQLFANAGLGSAAASNVGTAANNVVQLDSAGALPALDAAALILKNAGSGSVYRSLLSRSSDIVLVKDFGTNAAAFAAAMAAAIAAGQNAIALTSGNYNIGTTTLNFAREGFHVLALDPDVTITYSGTGNAVVFDGSSVNAGNTTYQTFGGMYPISIVCTNTAAAAAFKEFKTHHSTFNVRVKQAVIPWDISVGVCNEYTLNCSVNEVAPATTAPYARPWWPAGFSPTASTLDRLNSCVIRLCVEGCGKVAGGFPAVIMSFCATNLILGTAEGGPAGGIWFKSTSRGNIAIGVDNEENGVGADWIIDGDEHTLIGCIGALSNCGAVVSGHRNGFIACRLQGVTVAAGANDNSFERCGLDELSATGQGFVDNGNRTYVRGCTGVADKPGRGQAGHGTSQKAQLPAAGGTAKTRFVWNGMSLGDAAADELIMSVPWPEAGTFDMLTAFTEGSPGPTGQKWTVTFRKNVNDTPLTLDIPSGYNVGEDTVHSFDVVRGDRVCIRFSNTSGATLPSALAYGYRFTPK